METYIFSFVDVEGRQPEQVEWDMKYWWPHTEAIYATLLAYALTGLGTYEQWFERALDWSLAHFPDREHGEWFGYSTATAQSRWTSRATTGKARSTCRAPSSTATCCWRR